jgi:VanZ family protein
LIVIHAIVETNRLPREKLVHSIDKSKKTKPFYLAQLLLILYLCLVIYTSLTPFNFLLDSHLLPWSWLLAPTPRYIPIFDVITNIVGYLPFGFLMIFSLYPRLLKWSALIITLFLGIFVSGCLESLQTYLPTRIPSSIDWYSNTLGVLIGALFALPFSPQWLSGNRAARIRDLIFGEHQGFFLLLLLCPLAQIYPQNTWLGMGDFGLQITRISPFWSFPLNNASQEILITSLATLSIGTVFLFGMRKNASPLKLISGLLFFMVLLKLLISQFQFGQTGASKWWSASVSVGLAIGFLLIFLASFLSRKSLWLLAMTSILGLIILVNILPYNPYFYDLLEQLPQGKMTHINGLFAWISIVWPFLAIILLLKSRNSNL